MTTKQYNCDLRCQSNSESYDRHGFFGTKFREGQNFLLTVGSFVNKKEYSEADWLVPLIGNIGNVDNISNIGNIVNIEIF